MWTRETSAPYRTPFVAATPRVPWWRRTAAGRLYRGLAVVWLLNVIAQLLARCRWLAALHVLNAAACLAASIGREREATQAPSLTPQDKP